MNKDEVPYSILLSEDEYTQYFTNTKLNSELRNMIMETRKPYILVKSNKPRTMIHCTRLENVASILINGIECGDDGDLNDMGAGVYCYPILERRYWSNGESYGIVFNSNGLEYYFCIDMIDDCIAPIGMVLFTNNIPISNITSVLAPSYIKHYLISQSQPVDIKEYLYLTGVDYNNSAVNKHISTMLNFYEEYPTVLRELQTMSMKSLLKTN